MPRPRALAPLPERIEPLVIDRSQPAVPQIYKQLRRAIVRLEYEPRQPIFENAVAERSQISRTPIREALKRLRDEGLVEIYPALGSFVAPIDVGRTEEAIRLRTLLEGEAAATAARLPDAAALGAELHRLVGLQQAAHGIGAYDEVYEIDARFHRAIFSATKLEMMWSAVSIARAYADRVHYLSLRDSSRPQAAIRFHEDIADAIAAGDTEGARQAAMRHIHSNTRDLHDLSSRWPELSAPLPNKSGQAVNS